MLVIVERKSFLRTFVFLTVCSVHLVLSLKIAAFNIQVFGRTKAGKPEVMETLVRIISRYDIVLIQEIRDSSGTAIVSLLDQTNANNTDAPFSMSISERLGRTSSKEQYAFFYRPASGLSVIDAYTYDDGDESLNTADVIVDTFQREPYIVLFSSTRTVMKKFAIGGIHTDPDEAVTEIAALKDVFDDIKAKWGINNMMIMGDYNADCTYVPASRWKDIPLRTDSKYRWVINDEEDTTVSGTNCAYDRFVVTGPGFQSSSDGGLVPESARVFKFDAEYGLSPIAALAVSDHYPIELDLKDTTGGSAETVASLVVTFGFAIFGFLLHL